MENMIWDHLTSPLQNLSSLAKSEIRELQKSFPPLHPTLVHGAYFSSRGLLFLLTPLLVATGRVLGKRDSDSHGTANTATADAR